MLTLVLFLVDMSLAQDYCSFTPQHTLCPADKGPGPNCNGKHLARGVTDEEIKEVLSVHNRYRNTIALGKETRGSPGPQPGATDMREMTWDSELAEVAQGHADQCRFAHDCSQCRQVERFGVGQNLYIYKQSQRLAVNDWDKAITNWYEEVTLFDQKNVEPFQFSSPTGHYTALAWAKTVKVGCGATSYKSGKWFTTLYTCNYGPTGNFIRGQMYEAGASCSNCPSGTSCSSKYSGLCSSSNITTSSPPNIHQSPTSKNIQKPPTSKSSSVNSTSSPQKPARDNSIQVSPPKITNRPRKPSKTTTEQIARRKTTSVSTTTTVATTTTTRKKTTINNVGFRRNSRPQSSLVTTLELTTEPSTRLNNNNNNRSNNRSNQTGSLLFRCQFRRREASCLTKNTGSHWKIKEMFNNLYSELELKAGDKTEFFFQKLIQPPRSGIACLDFRYKKLSSGGSSSRLSVLAWPRTGKPGRVTVVQDSPDQDTWVRAQITLRKVEKEFLVMFRGRNRESDETLLLAVDDISVTEGSCPGAKKTT